MMTTTKRPPTDVARYAKCLRTYRAALTDATGTVAGTCRELYVPGCLWLEWQATGYHERKLVRRNDVGLALGAVL